MEHGDNVGSAVCIQHRGERDSGSFSAEQLTDVLMSLAILGRGGV